MLKSTVAREYRTKHPQMPSLALARLMYQKNKELFKNVEDGRASLRYIEGKMGSRHKKMLGDKSLVIDAPRPYNPYQLPESEETKFTPYNIKGHKRLLLASDIHIPYHSIDAVTAMIDAAKAEKVDGVLLNGDILDFYGLSRFEKDPRKRSFAHELEAGRQFFGILQRELKCKIYYKIGNHEERYEKFLFAKAPELLGVSDFKLENLLRLSEYNAEIITDKRIMKANKLNIIHGHEFASSVFSPVNVARGLFLRGKVSAIQGHNHATSEHTEPNMNGDITTTWSLGCLCELSPAYMPINRWNHGFAFVDLDENGTDFQVRNKRIFKGKVL